MKVISLKLAKQLKADGYPQDAGFWYRIDNEDPNAEDALLLNDPFESSKFSWCAAPSADEIIDLLPRKIKSAWGKGHLQIEKSGKKNYCIMYTFVKSLNSTRSLAEAAGRMWLYLKENNYA